MSLYGHTKKNKSLPQNYIMTSTQIHFTAIAQLVLDVNPITLKSTPVETNIRIDCSPELDESKYISEETVFTKEGSKIATMAFCQAIIGNIHIAHENGFRDSAEHLRYIIETITKGFAAVPQIEIQQKELLKPIYQR